MAQLKDDPIDLLLDANGDLVVENGDLVFSRGVAAVAQSIRIAIQLFEGEWFLDLSAGMPWYRSILGRRFDETAMRAAFRDAILTAPGVASLTSLTSTLDVAARRLRVSWAAIAEFGDTVADTLTVQV